MIKSYSIEEWKKLADKGIDIPVRILLQGFSMQPLIRKNKDYVTIIPLKRKLNKGDIVLFQDGSRYVAHRVWRLTDSNVITWGDNCIYPDRDLRNDQVLGLIVKIERGNRTINTDTSKARRTGIILASLVHFRLRFRIKISKLIKKPYGLVKRLFKYRK